MWSSGSGKEAFEKYWRDHEEKWKNVNQPIKYDVAFVKLPGADIADVIIECDDEPADILSDGKFRFTVTESSSVGIRFVTKYIKP